MRDLFYYMSLAQRRDVMARGKSEDVSGAVQDALDEGVALEVPDGTYCVSGLVLRDHTTLEGGLRHRGAWWGVDNKGPVFWNVSGRTISGSTDTRASLHSVIRGVCFSAPQFSDVEHTYFPPQSNGVGLEHVSFLHGKHAIKTEGPVYDFSAEWFIAEGQTHATISKQADSSKGVSFRHGYLRNGGAQAILLASGGSGVEVAWELDDVWMVGYKASGIAVFDVSAAYIRGCLANNLKFEGNDGLNSWCGFFRGHGWTITNANVDASYKGFECDQLNHSTIGTNTYSSLQDFALQVNASCNNGVIHPQANMSGAITNNGTNWRTL